MSIFRFGRGRQADLSRLPTDNSQNHGLPSKGSPGSPLFSNFSAECRWFRSDDSKHTESESYDRFDTQRRHSVLRLLGRKGEGRLH